MIDNNEKSWLEALSSHRWSVRAVCRAHNMAYQTTIRGLGGCEWGSRVLTEARIKRHSGASGKAAGRRCEFVQPEADYQRQHELATAADMSWAEWVRGRLA